MRKNVHSEQYASFQEWLGGRKPVHLSTNSGTQLAAFQTWRNFKEAFAPELVAQAVEETGNVLGRRIRSCIDPFGGSGTTALASQFLGIKPTTIEVNPYLADLIESKLCTYDSNTLLRDFEAVLKAATSFSGDPFPGAAKTFVEPGVNGKFLFSRSVACEIASIRTALSKASEQRNGRLFRVLLASLSMDVCNAVVSGKGRRYRRGWQDRVIQSGQVEALFCSYFEQAIYDIVRFQKRKELNYDLIRGDCRKSIPRRKKYDVAIFSPPYPNSFDYTDVYNVELWAGGYLSNKCDNRTLRSNTLRSHVQIKRSYETSELNSKILKRVLSELDGVRDRLWNKSIPDMVHAYFDDMNTIVGRLSNSLVQSGRAYMVVGDSQYETVRIPVADILLELASQQGYQFVSSEPFRSMRASPQQGGREELLETLIVLQRG